MTKCTFLFFIGFFAGWAGYAQDQVAVPKIINYSNESYRAGIQNWDIEQDKRGILYFGNNEGLVTFNGKFWNLLRLPNRTAVRSVEIDSKNRIYVGGQDEFGYFFPDKHGILRYTSLSKQLGEHVKNFADIWNIAILNNEVFFRSTSMIIQYKDGILKTYKPDVRWGFMGKVNNHLYVVSAGHGLMVYDKEIWKPFNEATLFKTRSITSILPYKGDTLLVSSLKSGLWLMNGNTLIPFKTNLESVFINDRVYTSKQIDETHYAMATTSGGVIIIDKSGRLVQRFNYRNGIQSNNVRGLLTDKHKNLWLALDDGIDMIAINSAIKTIFPDKNKQVTSYAVRKFRDMLYIATSTGLYASALDPGKKDLSLSAANFFEVPDTKGQVWNLDEINGKIVMAHEEGASVIDGARARRIYNLPGTWMFQPVSNIFPSPVVIAGTYDGLQKITFTGNDFSGAKRITGLKESLRFLVLDNGNIWAAHPNHGIYKITLAQGDTVVAKYTLYTQKDGLPATSYNYVYHVKNRLLAGTQNGIYEYDAVKNKFKPFTLLNKQTEGIPIEYIKEDELGNIWFISNKKVAVINFQKPGPKYPFTINYLSEMDGKVVGGFESIYPYDEENVFIGANKGVFLVNYKKYVKNIAKPDVLIGAVKLFGKRDSLLFGGYFVDGDKITQSQHQDQVAVLKADLNSVHFEYASTFFGQGKSMEFSYRLAGFDKEWSSWVNKNEKDYTNLPSGKYTFNVRARNGVNNVSAVASYTFGIIPAWYQTIWMYLLCLLIACFLIYTGFKFQRRKHSIAQARLSYLHQLELEHSEKEIVRLQYEKLETEVNYKNKELSTMTMHLVQRGKVLAKIKEVISMVLKNNDISDISPSFRHLVRLIRDVEKGDQELEHLTMHFNNVNTDFFNKLKDQYADLTPNDLKFCAYLRMNISSKEIAQLMNITIKAVEVGRYRLRKKLHLQSDVNLYDFLTRLAREKP